MIRSTVLAAIRFSLETTVPRTANRMKERQAFRDIEDWRTLWRKFEELGEVPKPTRPPAPKEKFEILGSGWTIHDVRASAAEGPNGEFVQRLEAAVNPKLDLAALRSGEREPVTVTNGRNKTRIAGGGSGSKKRPPEAYMTMLGALGEHFVYQQLRAVLPHLDVNNWVSKSKELFGYGAGNDD